MGRFSRRFYYLVSINPTSELRFRVLLVRHQSLKVAKPGPDTRERGFGREAL